MGDGVSSGSDVRDNVELDSNVEASPISEDEATKAGAGLGEAKTLAEFSPRMPIPRSTKVTAPKIKGSPLPGLSLLFTFNHISLSLALVLVNSRLNDADYILWIFSHHQVRRASKLKIDSISVQVIAVKRNYRLVKSIMRSV